MIEIMKKRSTSEVGHAKNVTNFTALIELLEEMGPMYNPSNPDIQMTNLVVLRDQLTASIQNLADLTPPFKIAVANRENAFKPLNKLSTRIKNSFNSLRQTKAENDNVLSIVKKIRGDAPVPKADKLDTEESKTISNAQLSYTSRATNFQSLVSLLSAYRNYTPNEPDLTLTHLGDLYAQLKNFNNEAEKKGYALITASKQRNDLLYFNPVNLLGIVLPIKDYIKSVEGGDPYYKAAIALQFTNKPGI
jgi:hypothetical protein